MFHRGCGGEGQRILKRLFRVKVREEREAALWLSFVTAAVTGTTGTFRARRLEIRAEVNEEFRHANVRAPEVMWF